MLKILTFVCIFSYVHVLHVDECMHVQTHMLWHFSLFVVRIGHGMLKQRCDWSAFMNVDRSNVLFKHPMIKQNTFVHLDV